jgi:hypothetical protein
LLRTYNGGRRRQYQRGRNGRGNNKTYKHETDPPVIVAPSIP